MSFEGYVQQLCENGHLRSMDVYEPEHRLSSHCEHCESDIVWENVVDCTNEPVRGYVKLEILEPAKKCTCPVCGNEHIIEPARYKIPKDEENACKS